MLSVLKSFPPTDLTSRKKHVGPALPLNVWGAKPLEIGTMGSQALMKHTSDGLLEKTGLLTASLILSSSWKALSLGSAQKGNFH